MSSIVSRRPSSRNHWKDAFWMSIRLGRSRTCLRREKLVRARGALTLVVKRYSLPYSERENPDRRRRKTTARPVKVPEGRPPTQGKACGIPRRPNIAPAARNRKPAGARGAGAAAAASLIEPFAGVPKASGAGHMPGSARGSCVDRGLLDLDL